jgi:hypothetical protein
LNDNAITHKKRKRKRKRKREMIKIYRLALSFIVLVSLSVTAHASLVTADWKVGGDGLVALDGSGLEWLDLSETIGKSFTDVSSELGVGGDFEGFTYATLAQVSSLFAFAGWDGVSSDDAGTHGIGYGLLSLGKDGFRSTTHVRRGVDWIFVWWGCPNIVALLSLV